MATTGHTAVTSGASKEEAELRRRNVQSYQNANGGQVYKLEAEDKKKLQKKACRELALRTSLTIDRTRASSNCSTSTNSSLRL